MKKISVSLLFFMLVLLPLMSEESLGSSTNTSIRVDSTQTVRLSVTTSNTVFLGVAENEVNSSILPKTIDSVTFSYNPRTMNWETPSVYFFVISFVKDRLKVTLTAPANLKNGSNTLDWTNASSVPITPGAADFELITEKDESSKPRVHSWEMKLIINGEQPEESPIVAGEYSGVFVLGVTTV
ncbi:MAG: hypothetical protein ACI4NB_10770 [Candidatus Ornithospirochaeta sp.]